MDTLPSEILGDVFLESVIGTRTDFLSTHKRRELRLHPTETIPLTLSHVCRDWRNTALSFGELWSFLSFNYQSHAAEMVLEMFETCIRRTNGCPLNFSISIISYIEFGDTLQPVERIIDIFFSQQHRWQDVRLTLGYPSKFQNIRADHMPLLRSLSLSCVLYGEKWEDITVVVDVAKSTRLTGLHLHGSFFLKLGEEPIYTLTEPVTLVWPLKSESSGKCMSTTCRDMLKRAPNLKQLRIVLPPDLKVFPRTSVEETQNFVPHDLRALSFRGHVMPFRSEEVSFRRLNALHFTEGSCSLRGQLLAGFVEQFTPPLTFLHINSSIDSQLLVATLWLLPTLRTLQTEISDASKVMPFLQALTLEGNDDEPTDETFSNANHRIMCPYLHSLRISVDADDQKVSLIALRTMLESRHRILNTFQRIRICRGPDDDYVLKIPLTLEDLPILERHLPGKSGYDAMICIEGDEVEPNPFDY